MGENAKWLLRFLWLAAAAFGNLSSLPMAQNPMETVAAGILNGVSSMTQVMSNMKLAHEGGLSSEFFKLHSQSVIGTGKTLETKRKRRNASDMLGEEELLPLMAADGQHPHQHRGKRSPCHRPSSGGGGGTNPQPDPVADGTDYDDLAERRRRQRKRNAQRNAQRKRAKSNAKKTSSRKVVSRRRRQAGGGPDGTFFDEAGQKINAAMQDFSKAITSAVGVVINTAKVAHQSFHEAFQDSFGEKKPE